MAPFGRPIRLWAVTLLGSATIAVSAYADSVRSQDFQMPVEITSAHVGGPAASQMGMPVSAGCSAVSPERLESAQASMAGCLAGFYPLQETSGGGGGGGFVGEGLIGASSESSLSMSMAGTVAMSLTALAMMILAGFNSRKRHRTYSLHGHDFPETVHSRWDQD